jgi:hypothetical protein
LAKSESKTGNAALRYQNNRGEIYEVGSDQQLERVLKEASANGVQWLELKSTSQPSGYSSSPATSATSTPNKVATSSSAASTPAKTSTYSPASSPASYATQSPSSVPSSTPGNRAATHSATQAGEYHIVTWNVAGDASCGNPKPKMSYSQTHDEFNFWPLPCQHDSEIRVVLRDGSTLVFESVYTFEDISFGGQKGVSTAKVTQTIGLPIKVGPNLITLEGHKIIIKH